MVGRSLGHYEILAPLGAGGMGEVYRAQDTNLRREVALKLLPAELARDPERLARLQREAHLLAALNHPNIAAIHSLEQHEDTRFLVMELVEGETLAEQLARGPMPVQQALATACQIAKALEAAHEGGIIHRDLKPANVKITPEFVVKVLDFGLAKATDDGPDALSSDLSQSPTLMVEGTRTGIILGTAAYMSPEQAHGRALDKRTDIWSFGLVLYEMLTGDTPFTADTLTETLAGILRDEPDWDAVPAETPRQVQRLLRRCLRKERGRRLRDIGDARIEIEDALSKPADAMPGLEAGRAGTSSARWQQVVPWTALGIVAGVGAGLLAAGSVLRPEPQQAPRVVQTSIATPSRPGLAANPRLWSLAISPDGSRLVYSLVEDGESQLFSRSLGQPDAVPIPGTEDGRAAFFSPDGAWLGFFADGKLKKVRLDGGVGAVVVATVVDPDAPFYAGSWGPDDTIVVMQTLLLPDKPGLVRIPASGGDPESLTTVGATDIPHKDVHVLANGRAFLFMERRSGVNFGNIVLQSFATGDRQVLAQGQMPLYLRTGHVLYRRNGTLFAKPLDAERLEATGAEFPVTANAGGAFAVSQTGTLVYGTSSTSRRELVLVDLKGRTEPLPRLPIGDYAGARFSPDGRRLVTETETEHVVHVYELETERNRLLFSSIEYEGETWGLFPGNVPVWHPEGRSVAVAASSGESRELGVEMFIVPIDGGAAERLLSGPDGQWPGGWSPDGSRFMYLNANRDGYALWELPLEPQGSSRKIAEKPGWIVTNPAASPDGRWLAYDARITGPSELYLKRYDAPGPGRQISIDGGAGAVWAPDGKTLYYLRGTEMMAVDITTDPEFEAGRPRVLFGGVSPYRIDSRGRRYDLHPKGQRFVVARPVEESQTGNEIQIVQNWFERLKQLSSEQ